MKIAVLLAAYNGEKYITEQLESLERQSFRDFVCYIHDDGSSDRTAALADAFCSARPDRFVRLDYPSAGGASENFFSLLARTDAPYVMFCDQDDSWLPDKLALTLSVMEEEERAHPGVPVLVCTDSTVTAEDGTVLAESFQRHSGFYREDVSLPAALFSDNNAQGATIMLNRSLREAVLQCRYPEGFHMYDHWCALVAAAAGRVRYLDTPTMLYRQHEGQAVGASAGNAAGAVRKAARWFFGGGRQEKLLQEEQLLAVIRQLAALPSLPEKNRRLLEGLLSSAGAPLKQTKAFLDRSCGGLPEAVRAKQALLLHLAGRAG